MRAVSKRDAKAYAVLRTTEETCGDWLRRPVRRMIDGYKVTDSLRHTAGCSFYQGQCQENILIALYKPEIIDLEACREAA